MTKVYLSGHARDYLKRETAYLRKYSPAAAKAFVARMAEARTRKIPRYRRRHSEPACPGTRRLVVGDYILDYELGDDAVIVLSIRHGRQEPAVIEIEPDCDYEDDID